MSVKTEYHFKDKTTWSAGPWQNEPDKVSWTDPRTGLPCLIVRGGHGALCGYVGVDQNHPYFSKPYDDLNETEIDCHGGLTFASLCQKGNEHGICHIPEPGKPDHVWWFGFDCAHSGDRCPGSDSYLRKITERTKHWETYRDIDYVTHEVEKLAEQLAKLCGSH